MKTIAPAAMAAIEAGTAIVGGAVEITPNRVPLSWSTWVHVCDTGSTIGSPMGGVSFNGDLGVCYSYAGTFGSHTWVGADPGTIPDDHNVVAIGEVDSFGRFWSNGAVYNRISTSLDPGSLPDPIRLWSGYGTITIDGGDYEGIGAHGLAQQNAGAVGGVAQGLTLGLSGIDPVALELLDGQEIKGASVVLYRLIFANDAKTMLDAHVFDRGRVDVPSSDETIGGTAAISVAVESAARGLGRNLSRMRADSDQRLIDPHDGYFARTAAAPFISLYWGGRKPTHFGGDATMGM